MEKNKRGAASKTINELPDEMLIKVFEELDSKSLKNCALSQKRFVHCSYQLIFV